MITGRTLIEWGFTPGPWFGEAIAEANRLREQCLDEAAIRAAIASMAPQPVDTIPLRETGRPFSVNLNAGDTVEEKTNFLLVTEQMEQLMRVPTIVAGAVMPDACPAGVIPVGGVVATENAIHPGLHSADICCSVAVSVLGHVDPKAVLDNAMLTSHFGPGGRDRMRQHTPSADVVASFKQNRYLKWLLEPMYSHFATQGDGNHFFYVGFVESTGETAIVTHHGSRKPGAMLYKAGMRDAERYRGELSPQTPKAAAWLPATSPEGESYWEALQLIREWTRQSHFKIHQLASGGRINDHFWNEHNFVFEREGRFYHAKGATPGWSDYERTIVPLNMAEPVLITRGHDAPKGLGFLPHGAGRNFSRTQYLKRQDKPIEQLVAEQTKGLDVRFWSGVPDATELPGAYKNAAEVLRQMQHFGLAEVVDRVLPYGSIMAGDWITAKKRKYAFSTASAGSASTSTSGQPHDPQPRSVSSSG